MPQYQEIDRGSSAAAQGAGNFAQGFSENLKRARDQQAKMDLLNQILYPEGQPQSQNPTNAPNAMQGPSYLGPQGPIPQVGGPPDNLTPMLKNVSQSPDILANQGNQLNFTPQKQAELTARFPELAKSLKPVFESQNEIAKEERARRAKSSEELQKKNFGKRESLRKQRHDVDLGVMALETGEVGGFDRNLLADILGPIGQPLKNQSGALLESSMKNLLIDTVAKLTGQKNKWIETQVKSAIPGIGKSQGANEILFIAAQAELDIQERLLDTEDEIIQLYERAGQSPPSNLEQLVHRSVQPYAELRQQKEAYDMRTSYEKDKGPSYLNNLIKVPQGTPLTLERRDALMTRYKGDKENALAKAKELGYTIPRKEIFEIGK